jgi:HD-GYP domain-containing protein (c-di-GMP phosphodiesterase class II)
MSEEHLINSVNKHYLDRVMMLAEEKDIKATEDIFDARGMKLVAKGSRISRTLQERLLQRRLSKPFESSIAVESGIDVNSVSEEAKRIIDTVEPVRSVLKAFHGSPSPLQILSEIQFNSAMSTMLTIIQRGGQAALTHSVMVSLLSICLARKRGLTLKDQTVVALAGLLHDIGELYIEPQYLGSTRRLYPHEWRHVVVHPRIGQMLIEGLENYPSAVAQAVFEHHERFDGTGYPRQVAGPNISPAGQVVSVAELVSGVFIENDKALQRAELALKIIPDEHPRELVSAISAAMRSAREQIGEDKAEPSGTECESVRTLHDRIGTVLESVRHLADQPVIKSKQARKLIDDVSRRTSTIQRALSSTGLDTCVGEECRFFDTHSGQILFETAVATREIQWRLRDVARDLSLQSSVLEPHEADVLQPLIELLDRD